MYLILKLIKETNNLRSQVLNTKLCDVKPSLKWAGGKGQLLKEIRKYYPFVNQNITRYAEPFVGGEAVLFDILSNYDLEEVYISDINAELINTYQTIRDNPDKLIEILCNMQDEFISLGLDDRKKYYLKKRERFHFLKIDDGAVEKAALMICLNKTCFNGLFRVNQKGLFNVPMGAYQNPLICDGENICAVSERLQKVTIVCQDYKKAIDFFDTLYQDYQIQRVNATRMINCNHVGRGKIKEILISNV